MKSRISFCNWTLIKKGLLRGTPLWGFYLLCMLISMPLHLMSGVYTAQDAVHMQGYILRDAIFASSVYPFFYGLGSACLLFSWLYRSRSANFFGALPLSRTNLFLSNYIAGLLYAVIPNLIIALLTAFAALPVSLTLIPDILRWLLAATLGYVFYYSFAVLCAMVVGHLAALPLLYVVLNFTVYVVEDIVRELLVAFVYGTYYITNSTLSFLSPLIHQLSRSGLAVRSVWESQLDPNWNGQQDPIVAYELTNWSYLVILAVVGILLAAAACWFHKRRRLEAAGDVIAVKQLRPVFLYCFTFGCSLVIGWFLASSLVSDSVTNNFAPLLLCMLAGAVLGFFIGQMMLQKSLRVFRRGSWLRCAISCGVIILAMLSFRFDLFGYAGYVPEVHEVASVSVGYYDATMTDPQFISRVIDFHQDIIDRQQETERNNLSADRTSGVLLTYNLKNGSVVTRRYQIPISETTAADPDSLIRQYETIFNDPDFIVVRELPLDLTPDSLLRGYVYADSEIYLSAQEVYLLLHEAVIPDLQAGRMGAVLYTDEYVENQPQNTEFEQGVELRFDHKTEGVASIYYMTIPPEAVTTIQALIDQELVPEAYFSAKTSAD